MIHILQLQHRNSTIRVFSSESQVVLRDPDREMKRSTAPPMKTLNFPDEEFWTCISFWPLGDAHLIILTILISFWFRLRHQTLRNSISFTLES